MLHPSSSIKAFMLHGNLTFDVQNMKYPLESILDITINCDNRTQLNQNKQLPRAWKYMGSTAPGSTKDDCSQEACSKRQIT